MFVLFSEYTLSKENISVSGTITDASTGETLIGATVRVKELPKKGAISNKYGFYSIDLPKGVYNIYVSYIGYHKYEHKHEFTEDMSINIKLNTESTLTGEVLVLSERDNNNITSTNIGIEKISIAEIASIPILFGERDIMRTLQLTPGVKSIGEGNGGMYVRGGDNSHNLIILDEAVVYNANHLLGFFSTFNSNAIKDITLYKGTSPAEYGGRLASVLDIRMNDGNNQEYKIGGGIGIISSKLEVEGPIVKDKGSFLIAGRRTYADLVYNAIAGTDNFLYFYDVNAKANYSLDDYNKIFISGYTGRDAIGMNDRFGIDWGNITGTLRWNHIWSKKLFSNTSLIYSDYDYKVKILNDANEFSISSVIKNITFKQDFEYFLNTDLTIKFGLNSTYNSIIPGQVEFTEDVDINLKSLEDKNAFENAVFISTIFKPSALLTFEAGFRLNYFNLIGPGTFYNYDQEGVASDSSYYEDYKNVYSYLNLEPRINISYIISEHNSLKFAYSRNSQNLHLISNSTSSTPTDLWIPSSQNVKPEIGDQISVGYFHNLFDNSYEISVESYYKYMQNQIDLKNGAEIRSNEYIEGELLSGIGRAYGLEVMIKKRYGKLTGWLGYTFSRTEKLIEGINNDNWYPAKQDITHDISIVGMYELNERWTISATWVYNTGNAVTYPSGKYIINDNVQFYYTERNAYRMPDYHRLDLGATYILKKDDSFESSLSFSIYNAYGRKNAYTIEFEVDPNDPNKTQAVKTYLFTFVPSITYNFKF